MQSRITMQSRSWPADLTALIARVGIGLAWITHGWPKIKDPGSVAAEFSHMGVYLPTVSAWYASIVEFAVAIALIVGIGLPIAGILLFLDSLGVIYFTVGLDGLIHSAGDSQLALVLGLGSLIAGFHGGRYALDHHLRHRREPVASHA
jgi:putative oxidoreductase